jgi:hypothetical protein
MVRTLVMCLFHTAAFSCLMLVLAGTFNNKLSMPTWAGRQHCVQSIALVSPPVQNGEANDVVWLELFMHMHCCNAWRAGTCQQARLLTCTSSSGQQVSTA